MQWSSCTLKSIHTTFLLLKSISSLLLGITTVFGNICLNIFAVLPLNELLRQGLPLRGVCLTASTRTTVSLSLHFESIFNRELSAKGSTTCSPTLPQVRISNTK